jgi:hypothetical protein
MDAKCTSSLIESITLHVLCVLRHTYNMALRLCPKHLWDFFHWNKLHAPDENMLPCVNNCSMMDIHHHFEEIFILVRKQMIFLSINNDTSIILNKMISWSTLGNRGYVLKDASSLSIPQGLCCTPPILHHLDPPTFDSSMFTGYQHCLEN